MKIAYLTLGCKTNQYETQAMARLLEAEGHETVPFGAPCGAVVLNTCAVTGESARKSRQAVRRAKSLHPGAKIVLCGCFPQSDLAAARALGADFIGGAGERRAVVDFLSHMPDGPREWMVSPAARDLFEPLPAGEGVGRTRALLKIQDGCENFCAYCIIPHLRGPNRSVSSAEAVRMAEELAGRGVGEIVLTGIEISAYRDGATGLAALTRQICDAAHPARIRLGSLDPRVVDAPFVETLDAAHGLCDHFHLSLQSGSDGVLARMGRGYTTEDYAGAVARLRKSFPDCALTTDLIAGFPGESEAELQETLAYMETIGFAMVHVFPYSPRAGTPAAELPEQIPEGEKRRRVGLMRETAAGLRLGYLERQRDRVLDVLLEREQGGLWSGHTSNYCEVELPGAFRRGETVRVRITGIQNGRLTGAVPSTESGEHP